MAGRFCWAGTEDKRMEYPLIIDGESAGSLRAEDEGLYIAFTARMKARTELTRLWLHGAGGEAYLGLMSPAGEELHLERRISKRELGALWRGAEYASNRSGEEEREKSAEEAGSTGEPKPDEEREQERGGAEQEPEERQGGEEPDDAEQEADETQSGEEDGLIWYRTESGILTAFDGKRRLTALPAKLRHENERVELRMIEGREYMIF